mmetsp:Transcript_61956/g.192053  ORF Transcript_61956/g.192053 Transcript_61956/m.192053 type:complete len:431 (-) Transcript_61956:150-1442(-)
MRSRSAPSCPNPISAFSREGDWLKLEGEPGYMLIAPDGELLRDLNETVVEVVNAATGAELARLLVPTTASAVALRRRLAELRGVPLFASQLLLGTRVLADGDTLLALGLPPSLQLVRLPFDEEQGPALKRGVLHGDAAAVAEALRGRACPDFEGVDGLTPLLAAARAGCLDLVADLHVAGADKDRPCGQDGWTPLVVAADVGHVQVARYLCGMLAEVDKTTRDGASPLLAAAVTGHLDVVEYLCGARAEVDKRTNAGACPLFVAAGGGHEAVVRALCKAGASVDLAMEDGRTPLQEAAREGHPGVVRDLCAAGAAKDSQNHQGVTPLVWAAKGGHTEAVQQLLEARADLLLATMHGATPLLMASQNGHPSVVRVLLAARAEVGRPLANGATPLFMATLNGHLESSLGGGNRTPLQQAAGLGHAAIADARL